MKVKMFEFLLDLSLSTVKTTLGLSEYYGMAFNPYHQYPKWRHSGLSLMDKRSIKQWGTRYNLGPQHTTGSGLSIIAPKLIPATSAILFQAAAGAHIAEGGAKGHDLYTAPQRRRVLETGHSGYSPHYRSI